MADSPTTIAAFLLANAERGITLEDGLLISLSTSSSRPGSVISVDLRKTHDQDPVSIPMHAIPDLIDLLQELQNA